MQLPQQVNQHRKRLGLSQEQLAERIYVTRQTVSNWETGRSYPDIANLLQLSELFGVTLDQLVKGDVSSMKQRVQQDNADRATKVMLLFAGLAILSLGVSVWLPGPWWWLIPLILYLVAFGASLKVERWKRRTDLKTYREILAYTQGGDVAAARKQRNFRQDTWDMTKILAAVAVITLVLSLLVLLPFIIWG